ncbi:MAG TPA: hypothetical protein VGB64_00375 [Actinomycetota bacterium]
MGRRLVPVLVLSSMLVAPLSSRAAEQRGSINIEYDGELNRAHGVRSGNGTPSNPYVISGWSLENLRIKDTSKAIKIVGNTITGTLTLDYIGPRITVERNRIGDLRVNQNVARWGGTTSGSFTRNTIGVVGQLRHFDGVFRWNTIGTPAATATSAYPDVRAVNLDGWNNARFANNKIYGYMDARIHGHHHSSEFGMMSHDHSGATHMTHIVDHSRRYHQVVIEANSIFTSHAYGLAYLDTNHAANDRTANSETYPYLNAPHTHYTRAFIRANAVDGSGILVNVFNAKDERHIRTPSGLLEIDRNRVTLERDLSKPFEVVSGIEVRQARYLTLKMRSNSVTGAEPLTGVAQVDAPFQKGAGILLNTLEYATVSIENPSVANRQYGVQAKNLNKTVRWKVVGLKTTNVGEDVGYDASVANAPARR